MGSGLLKQIEAKEAVLNAQAVFCLLLRNVSEIPENIDRHIRLSIVRLERVKEYIGKCEIPDKDK